MLILVLSDIKYKVLNKINMSNWDRNNKASLVPRKVVEVEGGHYDGSHFYILPTGGKLINMLRSGED